MNLNIWKVMYVLPSGKWKLKSYDIYFTAVPDNNDIEAIFTWRGHGRSFVGFLSGNVRLLVLPRASLELPRAHRISYSDQLELALARAKLGALSSHAQIWMNRHPTARACPMQCPWRPYTQKTVKIL